MSTVLLFGGCSGKVQTNPIPENRKFTLPTTIKQYNNTISKEYITDFREYANQKLRVEKFNVIEANKKVEVNNNNETRFWNSGYKKGATK